MEPQTLHVQRVDIRVSHPSRVIQDNKFVQRLHDVEFVDCH